MRGLNTHAFAVGVMFLVAAAGARGNLAITEIMSQAAFTHGSEPIPQGPDWIEITNYGTNSIDVRGYFFGDQTNDIQRMETLVFGEIGAVASGESILIAQTDDRTLIDTAVKFRNWWGLTNQPRVFFWTQRFGLGAPESIYLLDAATNLVDRVDLWNVDPGRTLVSHTDTGFFGAVSQKGVAGAFCAATSDDVGSPGVAPDPIDLFWIEQPVDLTKCVGSTATQAALAGGLPRAFYQWFKDGEEIGHGVGPIFSIPNVQPEDSGFYSVRASNCLSLITSRTVELTTSTNPFPLVVYRVPETVEVFPGQAACFEVVAEACPAPTFQWFADDEIIPGATGPSHRVESVTLEDRGTVYRVEIYQPLGSNQFSAALLVTNRPTLLVTELMSSSMLDPVFQDVADWVEVTNIGTNAANLRGYLIGDAGVVANAHLTSPDRDVVIEPGESVIYVRRLTPSQFRKLWGEEMLPSCLDIITFDGFGLATGGETVHFWNPGCGRKDGEFVVNAAFLELMPEDTGRSWRCGTDPGYLQFCIELSRLDEGGAWESINGDVGSPGYSLYSSNQCDKPSPVLEPILDQTISVGETLTVTPVVSAPDHECPLFTYALEGVRPTGAFVFPETGRLLWKPRRSQAGTTNVITLSVTDRRCPGLNATTRFTVMVNEYAEIGLGHSAARSGGGGSLSLDLFSSVEVGAITFTLNYPDDLMASASLSFPPGVEGLLQPVSSGQSLVMLSPSPGESVLGQGRVAGLDFSLKPGGSRVVVLRATDIVATKPDALPVMDTGMTAGSVVIVGAEPLLRALVPVNEQREVVLFGIPGATYEFESSPALDGQWTPLGLQVTVPEDDLVGSLLLPVSPWRWYRAREAP